MRRSLESILHGLNRYSALLLMIKGVGPHHPSETPTTPVPRTTPDRPHSKQEEWVRKLRHRTRTYTSWLFHSGKSVVPPEPQFLLLK